jgi:hypothetical protein
MKIKFNQIQDLNDARYASSALSEWVGFTLNQLPISKVQEIIGWCAGPKLAIELTDIELLETAISWCTILPINTLECKAESFPFLIENIPNAKNYEWIVNSPDINQLNADNFKEIPSVYLHFLPKSLDQFTEDILRTPNLIVNISDFQSNTSIIASLSPELISINCEPETTLGEKNFEQTTELFEALDIF